MPQHSSGADTLTHVSKPVISAKDLLVGYGGAPVCAPVTFTLAPGKVVALVGANGSGKSTVLRALPVISLPRPRIQRPPKKVVNAKPM